MRLLNNNQEMQQHQSCKRKRRTQALLMPSSTTSKPFRSIVLATALLSSVILLRTSILPSTSLHTSRRMNTVLSAFQIYSVVAEAKEIVATREWQRIGENDTLPAGLHVKIDLSTGEKWAKIPEDEERDEDIKASIHESGDNSGEGSVDNNKVESVEMDPGSGALSIVETPESEDSSSENNGENLNEEEALKRDYEMMHRVMSQLPSEELERFGGLPALPSPSNHSSPQLTELQRELFENRMEQMWSTRQEELLKAQESLADLPSMLKDRIGMISDYLADVEGSLKSMLAEKQKEEDDDNDGDKQVVLVKDVIGALRDLEYQLSDMDMARDFHTLGGWTYLVSLLDDNVHSTSTISSANKEDEELLILVDEVQAMAAMTIGTAVGNSVEFRGWALEDVSVTLNQILQAQSSSGENNDTTTETPPSAISLLIKSFEKELNLRSQQMNGNTMAVPTWSNAKYKSRATYKLRAVYALGSLLRGNPTAQTYFVSNGGAEVLIRDVLGTLSNVRGTTHQKALVKLDYKFASKVLALAEDVAMDVALHQEDYITKTEQQHDGTLDGTALTANQLVAVFTGERYCDLSLRMLSPPSDIIGEVASRGMKERALSAVKALGPGCLELSKQSGDEDGVSPWGIDELKKVRSEWNREGSDDGLDSVYRRELLDLVDGVLNLLQQVDSHLSL